CIAQQIAGGIAAAGVVIATRLAETFKAEVGREHQRRHHRAPGRIGLDAGAYRPGGGRQRSFTPGEIEMAHAAPSASASAARRIASTLPCSFRKASWP